MYLFLKAPCYEQIKNDCKYIFRANITFTGVYDDGTKTGINTTSKHKQSENCNLNGSIWQSLTTIHWKVCLSFN